MQFKAFEPGIEVNGQTVYTIVAGFKGFTNIASKMLLDVGVGTAGVDGLVEIDPAAWYPQESWLRAFEQISEDVGAVLYTIGLEIPNNARFPPWVQDVHSAVKSIDIAYHMNHRKDGQVMFDPESGTMLEGIGHYGCAPVEGRDRIVSVCENPYPCDFDLGILTTMAMKFQPGARVLHDDRQPCRKDGADSCTYIVEW